MKKNLLSFFFLLLFAVTAWAQDRTVTGTVTAREDGLPLPGVSIVVKGTRIGTQADANGKFSLRVPSGSNQLEFRFLGYNTHTATIGASNVVNVALSGDAKQLGEVVVTGYGTQRKKDFTGSAASVSGDKIKDSPVQSFDQALGGKASGVNIIQPNGVLNNPPVIRIRGFNSISLSSFPLVVVDGIPINTGDNSSNSAANNALGDINPADIESIDILKDAASTAIYGSRGAAGVLIITTKKGKSGAAKMTYDGWYGFTNAVRTPEVLNAQQYMEIKNEAVLNSKILGGNASNPAVASELFFPDYDQNGNLISTNWFNEVYRTAQSMNHSLSISGGTEKTSYYFSGNYSDQDGFIKKNSFERKAARFNVDHNATNWLKLSANINYTNNFNSAPNTGSLPGQAFNTSGLGRLAFVTAPNVAARNSDGSYNIRTDNTMGRNKNLTQSGFVNPLPILDNNSFTSESGRLIGNFGGTFSLYKGLSFRTSYGMDRLNVESTSFASPIHGDGFTNKGDANNSYQRLDNWNWSNTLNYATSIGGKHNLSLLTGYEVQSFNNNAWSGSRSGVADIFFDTYQGNYTLNNPPGTIYRIRRAFESYLASLNYDFGKRYFITANFRRDGNSALAAGKKFGDFGGASIGWNVMEEGFFKNSSLADKVNNLRFRASWGRVGNGNLNNAYGSYFLFGSGLYGDSPTLVFSQAGNSDLRWETSDQTNIGLDLGLFNDKVTFEATYFHNDINGLILNAPQAPSKGIPGNSILKNVGSMYNKGLELAVTATPVDKGKFSWNTSFNFTSLKNKVTALAEGNADIVGATGGLESVNITRVGQSVGSLFVVKTNGVNPENGRRIFVNAKGQQVQYQHVVPTGASRWTFLDGTTAPAITGADAQIIGGAIPTWYGGFDNTFRYGNLDLAFNMTYSGGNKIYNGTQAGLRDMRFWNNHTDVLNRWTTPGQVTNIPRVVFNDNVSNGSAIPISENVESGDFLKLRTATIGYRVPQKVFGKAGMSSLRVYAQVYNAFVLTKYSGSDPEISTNGNSNISPGVERNTVPQGRTFTFGVNMGF